MKRICVILVAAASLSAAALDNNTVTVTATRSLNLTPDQVFIYVTLWTAPDAGLDDALAKLQGTGITADSLTSVGPGYVSFLNGALNPAYTQWTFLLSIPFSKLKDTLAALTQAQKNVGTIQGQPALNANVGGVGISAASQAAQPCPLTALVSDARRQANAMAAAAGMKTGAIVAVGDGILLEGAVPYAVPSAVFRTGDFASGLLGGIGSSSSVIVGQPQPSCSLTVQFQLVQ
jgi:hypothetical protein